MSGKNYKEQDFEEHIVEHLVTSGYTQLKPSDYDKELCLLKNEFISFIKQTQEKEYQKLHKQYGEDTDHKICQRASQLADREGALYIFRKGFADRGSKFTCAYFKPANAMNPEHREKYQANRFVVIRQLKYSTRNENSIDMVIFLNGLPVITVELKNSLTDQFVRDAVKQYKQDRDPKESLLKYKRCLVHFAAGNEQAYMTTKLQGAGTHFLPFNKGIENPINPEGHKTAYLWEDIWHPDTILDLINNYLHIRKETEKIYDEEKGTIVEIEKETFIFPRYHQLDAVRALLKKVKEEGVGKSYLVQHSAGSGKSNSIAWLVHQLASLFQSKADNERMFDSILVITDRRNLDKQLQNTIKQFEQTDGVVIPIKKTSGQLKEALEKGKSIIVSTLQKYPVISESIAAIPGKRFAVVFDEAHSSTSGSSTKHLNKTLSGNLETAEEEDADDMDGEDEIIREIRNRGKQPHISYFGFTATPKNKTLELFGRKSPDGSYLPFHIYTMHQAIEEGFILDVLKNYTTFKRYFKLVKAITTDNEYDKKKAMRVLTSWVDLQPHAISMKAEIMLDHFLEHTVHSIEGRGRALVVCRSRLHAKKFYEALFHLMHNRNLPFKPLVAYSGTVEEMTEIAMNGLPPKVSIEDAFKTPEYRILVVANKFQTGFDEPLLHTMYVDKKLSGVQAVQTLSRLNRTRHGKTETLVLDFVNEPEEILQAFQPYFQATFLEEATDPNKLYDLQIELERFEIFTRTDVLEFAEIFFSRQPKEKYQPILDKAVHIFKQREEEEKEAFRSTLQSFIRIYGFISQIINFTDVELEKLFVYAQNLNRKLPRRNNLLPFELKDEVELDSFRIQKTYEGSINLIDEDGELPGITSGTKAKPEDELDILTNILKLLNETYGTEFTDDDKVDIERIKQKVSEDAELQNVMGNEKNTQENKRYKFNAVVDELILEFVHTKLDLYDKLTKKEINDLFKRKLFDDMLKLYERKAM